jgi:hypothetical protein
MHKEDIQRKLSRSFRSFRAVSEKHGKYLSNPLAYMYFRVKTAAPVVTGDSLVTWLGRFGNYVLNKLFSKVKCIGN